MLIESQLLKTSPLIFDPGNLISIKSNTTTELHSRLWVGLKNTLVDLESREYEIWHLLYQVIWVPVRYELCEVKQGLYNSYDSFFYKAIYKVYIYIWFETIVVGVDTTAFFNDNCGRHYDHCDWLHKLFRWYNQITMADLWQQKSKVKC